MATTPLTRADIWKLTCRAELTWLASQLMVLGVDATVESPPELMELIREQASSILEAYKKPESGGR